MKKKNILVAGGAGFVGSNLCEFLVEKGHRVVCLDNLSTGRMQNIKNLRLKKNFEFMRHDITKPRNFPADEIYHLASPASPVHYQKDPVGTWKANTLGTLNLLELARKQKTKFLFASTSEVYGDPKVHPQGEKYRGNVNPVGIRSCYDESKRAGESLCADYYRLYKFPVKIVRIFNTYGPNMEINDGRVVSNFIVQALKNEPITVYGQGRQTRSFQYIDDLIQGLVKMMEGSFLGPVNLGNPGEFTILHLAKLATQLTGSKSRIIYQPLPADDPKRRRPDISLAEKKLNWRPKVELKAGLLRTIEYFQSIL
ncbi:MAG: SDR family oxidoreductase [Patescibacteria group bacterium]|nr:SDR family oxidoreductase [Patescibacteria group bacterium]